MSKKLEHKDNRLSYGETHKIFPDKIKSALETSGGVLVLFDFDRLRKRNVFLFNNRLDEIWQIEDINKEMATCPYTSIYKDGDKYMTFNALGFTCEINMSNGKLKSSDFTK